MFLFRFNVTFVSFTCFSYFPLFFFHIQPRSGFPFVLLCCCFAFVSQFTLPFFLNGVVYLLSCSLSCRLLYILLASSLAFCFANYFVFCAAMTHASVKRDPEKALVYSYKFHIFLLKGVFEVLNLSDVFSSQFSLSQSAFNGILDLL